METMDFVVSISCDVTLTREDIINNITENTGIKDMLVEKMLEDMNVEHDYVKVE